jgi:hypothetical protein
VKAYEQLFVGDLYRRTDVMTLLRACRFTDGARAIQVALGTSCKDDSRA